MPLNESQLLGRTTRVLGVSAPIDLTLAGTTPIFTCGDVKNRAPESITFVAFVGVSYNGGVGVVPATLQYRIETASDAWKTVFVADSYSTNPTILYPQDQQEAYNNGSVLSLVVLTPAASGTAIATAYGWTE